jgi:hypothetical protein
VASAVLNTTQQIGGSIGIATFSSLAAAAIATYLKAHAASATHTAIIANATMASYHLVFWIAAAVFLGGAVLASILFRSDRGRRRSPGLCSLTCFRAGNKLAVLLVPRPRSQARR